MGAEVEDRLGGGERETSRGQHWVPGGHHGGDVVGGAEPQSIAGIWDRDLFDGVEAGLQRADAVGPPVLEQRPLRLLGPHDLRPGGGEPLVHGRLHGIVDGHRVRLVEAEVAGRVVLEDGRGPDVDVEGLGAFVPSGA